MTTADPVTGSRRSRWLFECGFARLAATCFAGLLSLYGVYALITFFRVAPRLPDLDRAIMILGPSTTASAVLVSAATFAASPMRFDLLTSPDSRRRRNYWGQLVLFGLGAYLLAAFGPPTVRAMLPAAPGPTNDTYELVVGGLRLLSPIPVALFAVLMGAIGAVVGRITSRSVLKHPNTIPWLACLGLVGAFVASFLGTSTLILQHGLPSVLIVAVPLAVPLIVTVALGWRACSGRRLRLRRGRERDEVLDPDTVDEVLTRVSQEHRAGEHPRVTGATTLEHDVVRLAEGIRRVAGSRASLSEAQVSSIVEHLVSQGQEETVSVGRVRMRRLAKAREFAVVGTSLGAGCLVVGTLGGLMLSISSAAAVGLIGSAVVYQEAGGQPQESQLRTQRRRSEGNTKSGSSTPALTATVVAKDVLGLTAECKFVE